MRAYTDEQMVEIAVGAVRHEMRMADRNPEDVGADAALDTLVDVAERSPALIAAKALDLMRHDPALCEHFTATWDQWADHERHVTTRAELLKERDAEQHDAIVMPDDPVYIVCRHNRDDSWHNAIAYLGFGFVPLPPRSQRWAGLLVIVGPRENAAWQCERLHSGGLLRTPDMQPVAQGYFTDLEAAWPVIDTYYQYWVPEGRGQRA